MYVPFWSQSKEVFNLPNTVTLIRTPLCVYALYTDNLSLFLASWGLDMIDGTLARLLRQESKLGIH